MCGRFAMDERVDELIAEFVAEGNPLENWVPSYSIAPTDRAPVIRTRSRESGEERRLDLASWGLRPSWAKQGGPRPINARLESAASNGMFRSAFASSRCLVPMRGYYEWETRPDGKQPHFLHGSGLLAAAGLYAARKETDGWALSFTVITREARDASGRVHDRMPVFLPSEAWETWLDPAPARDTDALTRMLDRRSESMAATLTSYPVSRRVNSVQKVDPTDATLLDPLEEEAGPAER